MESKLQKEFVLVKSVIFNASGELATVTFINAKNKYQRMLKEDSAGIAAILDAFNISSWNEIESINGRQVLITVDNGMVKYINKVPKQNKSATNMMKLTNLFSELTEEDQNYFLKIIQDRVYEVAKI